MPVLKSGGMEFSEQLVVEQLKQGNEEAYRYLYRNHYSMLCHVAREFVGDGFLAETLVGDVISIFGKFASFWIYKSLYAVIWYRRSVIAVRTTCPLKKNEAK